MLILLSPAKTLDYDSPLPALDTSQPRFLPDSRRLAAQLRGLKASELAALMHISPALAELNARRFKTWKPPFTPDNARPAVFAFKGDVYQGLRVEDFGSEDLVWAQAHLRILSGLYGVLRPLDLIQPYRLEMGTRLGNPRGENLYDFWGAKPAQSLNRELREQSGEPLVVNLASQEYARAVDRKRLEARVISPAFKEAHEGGYRMVTLYAKQARGLMAAWLLRTRARTAEDLLDFDVEGYCYNPEISTPEVPVFTRRRPETPRKAGA